MPALELEVAALDAVVKAANVVAKQPWFAEFDPEALLTTFREKLGAKNSTLTQARLLELFLGAFACVLACRGGIRRLCI